MFTVQHNIVPRGGRYQVNFGVVGEVPAGLKGRVSVSRRPDHSFYAIQDIHKHTGNGPTFNTVAEAQLLVKRVEGDVKAVLQGLDPSTNSSFTGRGEIAPKYATPVAPPAPTTLKVNNPPAAGASVVGTGSTSF